MRSAAPGTQTVAGLVFISMRGPPVRLSTNQIQASVRESRTFKLELGIDRVLGAYQKKQITLSKVGSIFAQEEATNLETSCSRLL